MSDEIVDIVDTMELAVKVSDLDDKVDMLRSEVDTIGNVLLQLIHARNDQIARGDEE
jgi:hypothetical protein